ncbi:class I SAM-dependent methyltransferase [Streptomyces sp. NPDC006355]|uniref:class I SAM-dependent methyltransferase n=1 Tax=Streptomyces sp. NPDC006355 TaxID=3156758 RepID=UPI0033B044D9
MTSPPSRIPRALDRFHTARPWDHNAHFHPWILRQLPARPGSALDVGCGSGDLARLLAGRAGRVHGIDADPAITARARELTPASAPVTYTVAEAPGGLPDAAYDALTCVAYLLSFVSVPLNIVMALLKNRGRRVARPVAMTARTRAADMTFSEIAREARTVLPGARLRRRLFWRYTLVWHRR